MDELQKYLDILFADYGHSARAMELKAKLLLESQESMEKLMAAGYEAPAALEEIKLRIQAVGELIEGNRLIYINRFRNDCLQAAVIYSVIAWVFSMPLIVLLDWVGMAIAILFMLISAAAAWLYISKVGGRSAEVQFLNTNRYHQRRHGLWRIWMIGAGVVLILIAAISFTGGRTPALENAWDWAKLLARFYAPMLSVAAPLLVANMEKLMLKNEVGADEQPPVSQKSDG